MLSVIVPAYRQENTIARDLRRIREVLDHLRYRTELICVVDGRVDKTFEKAEKYARNTANIQVVGYDTNKGKGHAVRYGMARSRGDIIAFIDAGMDINPNGLSMILEHFEWYKADIIVGSKRHPASKVNYPWQRRLISLGYQILIKILFNLHIRDSQVGLKCYRREVLEKVLPRLIIKQFAFDIEILAVANYLGFRRIFEAPIELSLDFGKNSTVTSKRFWYYVYRMLQDTVAVFYRLRILNYYSDENKRKWIHDPELNFRINTV